MFNKQADKLTKTLVDREIISTDSKEAINYGIATGFELILNLITTLAIGLILDMVMESIVFVLSFTYIRVYAGGYHLKKALNCYFVSNGIVLLVLLTVRTIPKEYMVLISFVLLTISIPIILQLAPIGTQNKPLSCREKYYFRQKFLIYMSIELIIIFTLVMFEMITIAFLMTLGIFVSSLLIVLAKFESSCVLDA